MTLGEVFQTRETWGRLSALRMPPQMAYRILKYMQKVSTETEIVERQRVKLIREAAGDPGSTGNVTLAPGTPQYDSFVTEFNAVLETDCDLKPLDMPIDTLLNALGAEQGNVLSVSDLAQLEPFFTN